MISPWGTRVLLVKIIASLGPASRSIETVERMVRAGASGFRINFAHGSPSEWEEFAKAVRIVEERTGRPLALMGDLPGPSVRIGLLEKPLVLEKGATVRLVHAKHTSEDNVIPVPVPQFFEAVDVGDLLVMDDGRVRLRVIDKRGEELEAIALTTSRISPRKAIVVQGKDLDLPPLSDRDLECLRFAVEHEFDYIALSYVRGPEDLELLQDVLKKLNGRDIGIMAKIETRSAIRQLDAIIEASDVIMVARGDLGMNFSLEEIHRYQRYIVEKSLQHGKPVIVATQLLESMVENPVPTRSEVVDVSIAVEEGVDALMLTGETSIGKYPVEAVAWLRRIIEYAEKHLLPKTMEHIARKARGNLKDLFSKFAKGVLELSEDMSAKLMVFTMHGGTARKISSLRPYKTVYAATPDKKVMRKLAILWGLEPIHAEASSYEEGLEKALEKGRELGLVNYGDIVVLAYGFRDQRQKIVIQRVEPMPSPTRH